MGMGQKGTACWTGTDSYSLMHNDFAASILSVIMTELAMCAENEIYK